MAGERDGVGHGDFLVLFPPASARAVRFVVCLRWGGGDSSRGGTVCPCVSVNFSGVKRLFGVFRLDLFQLISIYFFHTILFILPTHYYSYGQPNKI